MLVAAVLVLFFAWVAAGVFPDGVAGFKRGFEAGMKLSTTDARFFVTELENLDPDAHVVELSRGAKFTEISSSGELVVPKDSLPKRNGWRAAANAAMYTLFTVAFFTFFAALIVFACKFPRRRILDPKNTRSLRLIAASLGALGLAWYGVQMGEYAFLADFVRQQGWRLELPSIPTAIIVAAMLWAMAEIMNLAARLQNETELTI